MNSFILGPFLFCLASLAAEAAKECCDTKIVENAPNENLNGVFTLKSAGMKRAALCMDGCVYVRDGEEFCFIEKPIAESAEVECKVGILTESSETHVFNSGVASQHRFHSSNHKSTNRSRNNKSRTNNNENDNSKSNNT